MEAEARRWVAQGIRGEVQPETPQIQDGLVEDSTHTTMMVQPRSGKMSQPQSVRKEAAETPKDRLAIEDEDRTEGRKKAAEGSKTTKTTPSATHTLEDSTKNRSEGLLALTGERDKKEEGEGETGKGLEMVRTQKSQRSYATVPSPEGKPLFTEDQIKAAEELRNRLTSPRDPHG